MLALLGLPLGSCRSAQASAAATIAASTPAEGTTLLIFYDAKVGKAALLQATKKHRASILYQYRALNGVALMVPAGVSLAEAKRWFSAVPGVLTVQNQVNTIY